MIMTKRLSSRDHPTVADVLSAILVLRVLFIILIPVSFFKGKVKLLFM